MMFITPMPPTISERKHMNALAMVTTVARLSNMPRIDSLETTSKSFSFDVSSPRTFRKAETA